MPGNPRTLVPSQSPELPLLLPKLRIGFSNALPGNPALLLCVPVSLPFLREFAIVSCRNPSDGGDSSQGYHPTTLQETLLWKRYSPGFKTWLSGSRVGRRRGHVLFFCRNREGKKPRSSRRRCSPRARVRVVVIALSMPGLLQVPGDCPA